MITKEIIIGIMPNAHNLDVILPFFIDSCKHYEINTSARENAFLAQVAHESGEFRYLKEIASGSAYEGRVDLGNTEQGDGIKYKGRGLIQITGRANYQLISNDFSVDFIGSPELLETPEYATRSAGWFWDRKKLNRLADIGDFVTITKRINGGTNGLIDREMYWNKAKIINP